FSKFNYFLGKQTNDKKETDQAFAAGRDAGKIASNLASDKPDGYFWFGANLGEIARNDPLAGIIAIKQIRDAMNRVIEIQPGYQKASAYDALAEVELETRITGGSAEKAVELLNRGLEIDKSN